MDMDPKKRREIERKIFEFLFKTAKEHGYEFKYVDDGGERHQAIDDAIDNIFAVDSSTIVFKHPLEEQSHCVCVVLGNDGYDPICDASLGGRWDEVINACDDYANRLEDGADV